jgi:hypothetical protein
MSRAAGLALLIAVAASVLDAGEAPPAIADRMPT